MNRNDRSFSKKVYTKQDKYTGKDEPWTRTTIDLGFAGGNYFGMKQDFKEGDIRNMMGATQLKGSF